MKKTKFRPKPKSGPKKIKWREVLTTAFAIVSFSATVIFIGYRMYSQETHAPIGGHKVELPSPGIVLEHNKVCMASNVYMGEQQLAVTIAGRQYYSCSSHCTQQLQSRDSVRLVQDPYTKTLLDKSEAIITMSPERARAILYFATEDNMKKYLMK
jgi:hypothetical protein